MQPNRLVPLLAALLLVATSGCMGILGDDTSDQAKRIQEQALQSMQSADEYAVEMTMSVEAGDRTVSLRSDAVVDRPERKLRMDMSMSGMLNQDVTVYFSNETMYANDGSGWQTRDISDRNVWDSRDQLASQRELLNASSVSLAGNETLDGTPVHVLELDADEGKLRQQVEQQMGSNLGDVSMENVTFRYYVATDSYQVHRIEMSATMLADGTAGSVSMTMRFSDFGSDVSIQVPDEATASAT